ncbi:hypothetical protein D3C75_678930 [compost metagenome]
MDLTNDNILYDDDFNSLYTAARLLEYESKGWIKYTDCKYCSIRKDGELTIRMIVSIQNETYTRIKFIYNQSTIIKPFSERKEIYRMIAKLL